ncbi:hypothetical protein Drorol1_Dr00022053 [Drosera rotundifolia]
MNFYKLFSQLNGCIWLINCNTSKPIQEPLIRRGRSNLYPFQDLLEPIHFQTNFKAAKKHYKSPFAAAHKESKKALAAAYYEVQQAISKAQHPFPSRSPS